MQNEGKNGVQTQGKLTGNTEKAHHPYKQNNRGSVSGSASLETSTVTVELLPGKGSALSVRGEGVWLYFLMDFSPEVGTRIGASTSHSWPKTLLLHVKTETRLTLWGINVSCL